MPKPRERTHDTHKHAPPHRLGEKRLSYSGKPAKSFLTGLTNLLPSAFMGTRGLCHLEEGDMWDFQLSGGLALLAGLALLPGAIAILIRNRLGGIADLDRWLFVVHAAVFDAAIFVALLFMRPLGLTPLPIRTEFNWLTLVAAGLLALFFGLVTGIWATRGTWQKILYRLGWTKKGKRTAWVDGFQLAEREGAWAYVHLKDGRRVLGAPKFYSDEGEKTTIFLVRGSKNGEPVRIYDKDGKNPVPQNGPGVLITPAAEVPLVSFLDSPEKAAGEQ